MQTPHTLYSYRRCPYAMRARMALITAQIQCDVYDINFRDKPDAMLAASPKGTVPVLITNDNQVIDESLDIMRWALKINDPQDWITQQPKEQLTLIAQNDGEFKKSLDRYKYPTRFENEDCSAAKAKGLAFLTKLNNRLSGSKNLMGDRSQIADIAIFPFIRQFANVDRAWFDALPLPHLQTWLTHHLSSPLFKTIFKKHEEQPYALL
jgi:glutathione S-transferase